MIRRRSTHPDLDVFRPPGSPLIAVYLNYPYRRERGDKDYCYFRCITNEDCEATLRLTKGKYRWYLPVVSIGHFHDPDLVFVETRRFQIKVRKIAEEDLFTLLPVIYHREYLEWKTTEEVRQALPKYADVFESMRKARKEGRRKVTVGPDFFETEIGQGYLKVKKEVEEKNEVASFLVSRGNTHLFVYDGHIFVPEKTESEESFWICSFKEKKCKAWALFKRSNYIHQLVNVFGSHKHEHANKEFLERDFATKLRELVAEMPAQRESKIFIQEGAAAKPHYTDLEWIEKLIAQARARLILPLPSAPEDLTEPAVQEPTSSETTSVVELEPNIENLNEKEPEPNPPTSSKRLKKRKRKTLKKATSVKDTTPPLSGVQTILNKLNLIMPVTIIKQEIDVEAQPATANETIIPDLPTPPLSGAQTTLHPLNLVKSGTAGQEIDGKARSSSAQNGMDSNVKGNSVLDSQIVIKQEIVEEDENLPQSVPVIQSATSSRDSSNHVLDIHSSFDENSVSSVKSNSDGNKSPSDKGVKRPRLDSSPVACSSRNNPPECSEPDPKRFSDHFDAFATFVAAKLRTLNPKSCSYVEKAISNLLFEAELGLTLTPQEKNCLQEKRDTVVNGLQEAVAHYSSAGASS